MLTIVDTQHATDAVNINPERIRDHSCPVCEAFLEDWLRLPLVPDDALYIIINPRAMNKNAARLAKCLYSFHARIAPMKIRIDCEYIAGLPNDSCYDFCKDRIIACIHKIAGSEELEYIQSVLEDEYIVLNGFAKEWIGYWIINLWNLIGKIHLEHQKKKPAEGGGPAFGMRSFKPTKQNEVV